MAACTFCGASEDSRRFLVEGRSSGRLCDRCLCELAKATAFVQGLEPPRGLARLGVELPKMWPFERQLRRINYLQRSGQLNVPRLIARTIERGFARFEKQRKPARPASPLSVYFVRPAVRPLAQLERACGFCGEQRRRMLTGTSGSRICETCLAQARGLLG